MKKQNTSAPLAVISQAKVQPKPTKTEIITAMVERARAKVLTAQTAEKADRERLIKIRDAAAKKVLQSLIKSAAFRVSIGYVHYGSAELEIYESIKLSDFPELEKAQREFLAVPNTTFNEAMVRESIKKSLDQTPARVASLLADPAVCASLDSMLAQIP